MTVTQAQTAEDVRDVSSSTVTPVSERPPPNVPKNDGRKLSAAGRVIGAWDRFGSWLNSVMPKGLYARALLIILAPMVILQSVIAFVFMERHWNTVTQRLSAAVVQDIAALIDVYKVYPQDADKAQIRRIAQNRLGLTIDFLPVTEMPPPLRTTLVARVQTLNVGPGTDRPVEAFQAPIRLIGTRWLYDRVTRTLFTTPDPPTALFCANDRSAQGAYDALRDLGLSIPGDVSVVGFDDSALMMATDPPLTTVRQPIEPMARGAVQTLLSLISGNPVSTEELLFEPELVVRGSTGSLALASRLQVLA